MREYKLVRYIEFNRLFELFFVSAIAAILIIRFYLRLTGFPQISAGELHIAHMIWGGLVMLLSLLAFMLFLNDDVKSVAAVLGGIGFGTFIDEIGKFITKDNNYFYQPTFALIYVIFVCLYLFYKLLERRRYTEDEYLVNSVEELKEVIIKDLDKEEKAKALHYLSHSDQKNPITHFLRKTFGGIEEFPDSKPGYYTMIKQDVTEKYRWLLRQPWFLNTIMIFFLVRSLWFFYNGIMAMTVLVNHFAAGTLSLYISPRDLRRIIQIVAILLQAVFTISGIIIIRQSRRQAYVFFKNAVLISIFVLQIYNFYRTPAVALLITLGDLLLLSILNYMIKRENAIR